MTEFETKQKQLRDLLQQHGLDRLVLKRVSSFAWATCGASSYINTAASDGTATLVITPDKSYLLADNIETTRLEKEEKLRVQGWEFVVFPWHSALEGGPLAGKNLKIGADSAIPGMLDLSVEIGTLRANLLPVEQERIRVLGRLCGEAMFAAIQATKPGMTEYEIAAVLAFEAQRRGAQGIVNLIATDERIFAYRHPLPTAKKLDRYAMLVLCGRQHGLVCSVTRFVHFGAFPAELEKKYAAVLAVDAAFINGTRPGRTISDVFQDGKNAYAQAGYADEWQLHHQGGPAGYEPREFVANSKSTFMVQAGQPYAWNPSITGTKVEDTILIQEKGVEVLTEIAGWPVTPVKANGVEILRPAVWVVK